MVEVIKWIGLFALYAVTDGLYTYWMYAVNEGAAKRAGITAAVLMLFVGIGTISYTQNPWYLVPVSLGAGVGTSAVVWWNTKDPS